MKKSAKILVIAALVVSAVVMTSCSFLFGSKPSGTYVNETTTSSGTRNKQVYTFSGYSFKNESFTDGWLSGGNYDEPIISITGTFTVDGDTAVLTEKDTGLDISVTIKTTDNWKSFTTESTGTKFTKKGLF